MMRRGVLAAALAVMTAWGVCPAVDRAAEAERERAMFVAISRLHQSANEGDLLRIADEVERDPQLGRAEREQARFEALRVLEVRVSRASLPYLEELRADAPEIMDWQVLCRHPEPVAKFPYDAEASRLIWLVTMREQAEASSTFTDDEFVEAVYTVLRDGEAEGPRLAGWREALRSRGAATACAVIQRLGDVQPIAGTEPLLVEAALVCGQLPSDAVVNGLPHGALLHLLRESARLDASSQERLYTTAEQRSDTQSAARVARARQSDDVERMLGAGTEGAMVAARDRSARRTQQLAALLAKGGETARLAHVALVLQDTAASRAAAEVTP